MPEERVQIPPIKSQGIKTKLVPWIRSLVAQGRVNRWLEPFMGTGVVGFNINARHTILSDTNPHLVRFYAAIQEGRITSGVVREHLYREGLLLSKSDGAHYYVVRERFNDTHEPLDFLFLNRAGFNGMIRFNSKGGFNIPFCRKPERFAQAYITKISNQVEAIELIMRASRFEFYARDFAASIAQAKAGDIVYCDPPYIGRHADYFNTWGDSDERALHDALLASPAEFILSTWAGNQYRENPYIAELWAGHRIITREHYYHVGGNLNNRGGMTEAIIYSPGIGPSLPAEDEEVGRLSLF